MEGVLQQQQDVEADVPLTRLIPAGAVSAALPARTRSSVIDAMSQLAAGTGHLWDARQMAEAVRARESLHPTALDIGVALLHPRRPMPSILAEPLIALGKTPAGIPFGGERGSLTDVFFLICSVSDVGHLHTLARLSRLLALPDFLDRLRAAADAHTMLAEIRSFEKQL
jgi:PTS system nitrogen regulatory IIA component